MESNNLYIIDASGEKMAIDLDALRENATNAERQRILKLIDLSKKELDDIYSVQEKELAKQIFGNAATPEFMRERRYGWNQALEALKEKLTKQE